MTYLPKSDSLAARVCAFFARNPEDDLSLADIGQKFDVANKSFIKTQLMQSVATGLLKTARSGTDSMYSAGPRLVEALAEAGDAPAAVGGFTASLESKPAARTPFPSPDSLVIEPGVPIPTARQALTAAYVAVWSRMELGDSFKVPTPLVARLTANAQNWGKPLGRKFATRKIDTTHSRVWRTQ